MTKYKVEEIKAMTHEELGALLKKQAEQKPMLEWYRRDCSLCGYKLRYLFPLLKGSSNERACLYDVGCDCTGRSLNLVLRAWEDVAQQFLIQINDEVIEGYMKEWGLCD